MLLCATLRHPTGWDESSSPQGAPGLCHSAGAKQAFAEWMNERMNEWVNEDVYRARSPGKGSMGCANGQPRRDQKSNFGQGTLGNNFGSDFPEPLPQIKVLGSEEGKGSLRDLPTL